MKFIFSLVIFLLTVGMVSCSSDTSKDEASATKQKGETVQAADTAQNKNAIVILAKEFNFFVKDEIPSGWNTFRFLNQGHAEHFFLLSLLPDSITFERYVEEVSKPFDVVFDSLKAGMSQEDAGALLGSKIPSWYFQGVKPMGGSGIVSPGINAQVSMQLSPGTYVMECYIKEQGKFHSALGMIRSLRVLEEDSGLKPPQANMEITLTNNELTTEGKLQAGKNTVAVHFKEQPEIGLGNDVHLVVKSDTTQLKAVEDWMNWMNVKGLESPAPARFLGGIQEMPVGHTGYFTVDLQDGNYVWMAETGVSRGLVQEFTIK